MTYRMDKVPNVNMPNEREQYFTSDGLAITVTAYNVFAVEMFETTTFTIRTGHYRM